ncbi:MAG: putative selenate ABC transporter substrate-binding protein [Hyphomicrobiaceae bacterium]|nr:putative selenate ABC transporter substrate-binding protein [Hyphomicrobiaceae bacterium]
MRHHACAALSALCLAVCLLVCGQPARAQTPTLYFSAIPSEDEAKLVERFTKVGTYLAKTLGVPVQYVPVKSYPASVTALRNDQIQLGWFGGFTGVQARLAVPGSRAIAQGEEDPAYISYFIAHDSAGLAPSADFPKAAKGKSFTFGAKTSTSGRLMPEFFIRKATGEAPDTFFGRVGFSGDHTQTLKLVATGAFEIGALDYKVYDKAVAAGAPEVATAKIVWKTPPYPDYNWTVRGDLDAKFGAGFTDKLQQALIDMKDPDLLASFPRKSFIKAVNDDFAPIEATARELKLLE